MIRHDEWMRCGARVAVALAVVIGASGCAGTQKPIPVLGAPADASALAGTWEGEYTSHETRRHGSIRFELAADADSAFGDVVMLPPHGPQRNPGSETTTPPASLASQTLSIRFVRTLGDSVFGTLDPYQDPESGSTLMTRFAGRLSTGKIAGRYFTHNMKTAEVTTGDWSVQRKP